MVRFGHALTDLFRGDTFGHGNLQSGTDRCSVIAPPLSDRICVP